MTFDLPSILAFSGVLLTVIVNLALGLVRQRSEKDAAENDDEGAFQERLLKRIDAQEAKLNKQDARIEILEGQVDTLREENRRMADEKFSLERLVRELETEKGKLERVIKQLQDEIAKFRSNNHEPHTT